MARSTVKAQEIIKAWKGDDYAHGVGVLETTGEYACLYGERALLVVADLGQEWVETLRNKITDSLDMHGVGYTSILGAGPNAPREDVYRIANEISKVCPDSVIAIGGGSTIDAAKAASILAAYNSSEVMEYLGASEALASSIEPYFGAGNVTRIWEALNISATPVIAVQTIASSGAHLTKYANITDPLTGQKKLIIDMAIVPPKSVFDYGVTEGAPRGLTLDGALDGIAHLWEVFMGATGQVYYDRMKEIAVEGISLIVESLPEALKDPKNLDSRIRLGLGTDLGGYSIMIGGTNGGHLGSFSLVDILTHGRACAVLNPYYTVLFSPAIQDQLRTVGEVFHRAGFITENLGNLEGRALGEAVAHGMIAFSKSIAFPITLREAGATRTHIDRMIEAAKNPQLESKLKNMPTPMDPSKGDVETYMKPVLEAAFTGDFSLIKTMS
ncbi:MAG: iron-containing alcohol dehydrogenase [Candidatus Latescibacter sp.]|nr:iron-containing alcohol dehydrogenase [Candidatus Latescibacter sp.]